MLRVRCFFRHGSFFPCWHVAKPSPEEAAEPSPEEAPSLPANVGTLPSLAGRLHSDLELIAEANYF